MVVVDSDEQRLLWVVDNMDAFLRAGSVLIFANQRTSCDFLAYKLQRCEFKGALDVLSPSHSPRDASARMPCF